MKKLKILTVVVIMALAAVNVFISKKQTYSDVVLLNLEALANDYEWVNPEYPWDTNPYPEPGKIKDVIPCAFYDGNGVTASVQLVCHSQYVSTDNTTCTPYACGEYFGS